MTSSKHPTWVLITDSTNCRLYDYNEKLKKLALIEEIKHAENKLRDIDLTSDKPGRYMAASGAHGAFTQPLDPKEIKLESFSREISKALDHGRTTHGYEKLILIAPPHMNGLLMQNLNKQVKDLITHNIKKDIPYLKDYEVLDFLHQHIK